MKNVAAYICVLMLSMSMARAETGVGAFAAAVDEGHAGKDYPAAGITFDVATNGPIQVGANGFFFGNGIGAAVTLGARVNDWRFVGGVGRYADKITDQVNVAGGDVTAKGSDLGDLFFAEASYKNLFVRASQVDTDFSIFGARQTGMTVDGDPIYSYATKNVGTRDRWLWVGMRFSI